MTLTSNSIVTFSIVGMQRAQLSSNPTTSASTPTPGSLVSSQPQPTAHLTPPTAPSRLSIESRSIYPHTTKSPSASCSGIDLSTVHFVDSLDVITCGLAGGVFHSKSNSVTITLPEGAIPHGTPPMTFEFGVALAGPFDMPNDSDVRPVSPFIWICCDTPGFEFRKPISVIMPHFISCDSEQDCKELTFMKADRTDFDREGRFQFMRCDAALSSFKPRTMEGTFLTQRSGFLCICSRSPDIAVSKANYCLMMVMPSRPQERYEVTFCITYLLETCMEVRK